MMSINLTSNFKTLSKEAVTITITSRLFMECGKDGERSTTATPGITLSDLLALHYSDTLSADQKPVRDSATVDHLGNTTVLYRITNTAAYRGGPSIWVRVVFSKSSPSVFTSKDEGCDDDVSPSLKGPTRDLQALYVLAVSHHKDCPKGLRYAAATVGNLTALTRSMPKRAYESFIQTSKAKGLHLKRVIQAAQEGVSC